MNTTLKLTRAAIKMFVRSRQALFFTLFMPLVIMLIFGYIGLDKPQKTDVGLVTHSPAPQTAAFVEQIKQFPIFNIHEGSLADERTQMDQGNRSIVLDIPDTMISQNGAGTPMTAYINAGKQGEAQAVISILNQFISQMTIQRAGVRPIAAIDQQVINTHDLRYIDFLIPGLIALSIMQMSVFSVAFLFTQYKEKGVLKRLLATPMKPLQFVTANAVTRLAVGVVQTAIFILVGIILFKLHVVGSFLLLLLCVILGALMFLGLGFTVSGVAKTTESVPAIANLVVFPMLFLGNTFIAISNMPSWLQAIANVLPLTYFSSAIRDVMTKGAGFGDIKFDLLAMFIWATVLITIATITFRFQEKDTA